MEMIERETDLISEVEEVDEPIRDVNQASCVGQDITGQPDPGPRMALEVMAGSISLSAADEPGVGRGGKALTEEEQQDLRRCEIVIEENKTAFEATAAAMYEILTKRLYRAEYRTFKEYCQKRWKFSRSYGHRLAKAHETMEMLPIGDTPKPIKNENQARIQRRLQKVKGVEVNQPDPKEQAIAIPAIKAEEAISAKKTPAQEKAPSAPVVTPAAPFPEPPPHELHEKAEKAYNIFGDANRKKELELLLFKVKSGLSAWVKWETEIMTEPA
jgi:hypothetical protein